MPHDLTDSSSTFVPAITAPDDGDDANGALFDLPFQQLADRTAYLNALVDTSGVRFFRRVASTAALTAINVATLTDGDMRLVAGAGEHTGIYRYELASVATPRAIWVLQPDAGAGRWIHILADVAGIAGFSNALATLDADLRLVQLPVNALIDQKQIRGNAGFSTSSVTIVDVTSSSVSFAGAEVGDIVEVEASVAGRTDGASSGYVSIAIVDGATTDDELTTKYGGVTKFTSGSTADGRGIVKYRTVVTAGTITVKLVALNATGGASATYVDYFSLKARLVRP